MRRFEVLATSICAVQKLCTEAMLAPFDVICKQGIYVVNAKSILGLFSLNLTDKLIIEVPDCEFVDDFASALHKCCKSVVEVLD